MLNASQDIHAIDFQKAVLAFRGECRIANLRVAGPVNLCRYSSTWFRIAPILVQRLARLSCERAMQVSLSLKHELYELCVAVFSDAQRNKADIKITLANSIRPAAWAEEQSTWRRSRTS